MLRVPQRDALIPPEWASSGSVILDNCLVYDCNIRSLRCRAAMPPEELAEARNYYAAEADSYMRSFPAPGTRGGIEPAALHALGCAFATPKPLWLALHLWRNRVSRPVFRFSCVASLQRDLEQNAEDLFELYHARELDTARVQRVLSKLRRLRARPLRVGEAAGPLPDCIPYAYILGDDANTVMFESRMTLGDAHSRAFLPELSAVIERLFLAPPDSSVPYVIVTASQPVVFIQTGALCEACGGSCKALYYSSSPTWRHASRRGGALAPRDADLRLCTCTECDGCGVPIPKERRKRCSKCKAAFLCSDACLRRFWPDHQADCRATRAAAAAAAAANKDA